MTIKELIKLLQEYDDRHEIKVQVVEGDINFKVSLSVGDLIIRYLDIKGIDNNEGELFIELED